MRIPNAPRLPQVWSDDELAEHQQRALNAFVDRRLAEPSSRYLQHLRARRAAIHRLVRLLAPVDPANPDIAVVRQVLAAPELEAALRYMAGPPISADDLGVIVTRGTQRLTRRRINTDPKLANEILRLICRLADSERFPWVRDNRPPKRYELKQAIRATTSLHAAQTMQTERRNYGKEVERYLENRLVQAEFTKIPTPQRRQDQRAHLPAEAGEVLRRVQPLRPPCGSADRPAGWPLCCRRGEGFKLGRQQREARP